MQRLFSMFPLGRPGVALILVRFALSIMIAGGALDQLLTLPMTWTTLATIALAALLCLGVLTPLAATLVMLLEVVSFLDETGPMQNLHLCAGLHAAALALLGPGGYSLDARIFGRRQVILPTDDDSSVR